MKRYKPFFRNCKKFEESIPKYVYKIVSVNALIKILDNGGLAVSKENFNSLTKDWTTIYYNEDFELIYGYTLSDMCVIKCITSFLKRKNKLVEVEYTEQWMENHKDIRNYVMGYVRDFERYDWVSDLVGLNKGEQEIIAPKKLKLDHNSVDSIWLPTREMAKKFHLTYNKDNNGEVVLDRAVNWGFVGMDDARSRSYL